MLLLQMHPAQPLLPRGKRLHPARTVAPGRKSRWRLLLQPGVVCGWEGRLRRQRRMFRQSRWALPNFNSPIETDWIPYPTSIQLKEFNANLEKENLKNRYLARKIRKPVMRLNEMMKDDDLDADDERVKALVSSALVLT
jgi:hypothetical protein